MRSRFRVAGHPAHPILVMFPTAMLPLMIFLDGLHWYTGDAGVWTAGFWVAAAGLVMTLVAMVPGIVDLAAIPNETKAHRTAIFHLIVGVTILAVYAAAVWARWPAGSGSEGVFALALTIDVVGSLLVTLQGWLGGELVYKHQIGVRTVGEGADPVVLEGGEKGHGSSKGQRRMS